MGYPKARREGIQLRTDVDGEVIASHGDKQSLLSHMEATVWQLADGEHSVSELTTLACKLTTHSVSIATVWSALDRLADLGLLMARVSPPAADGLRPSRRKLLEQVGLGAAGALGLLFMNPATAQAGEQGSKESNSKNSAQEQRSKESNSKNNTQEQRSKEARNKGNSQEIRSKEARNKDSSQEQRSKEQRTKDNAQEQRSKEYQTKDRAQEQHAKESNNKYL